MGSRMMLDQMAVAATRALLDDAAARGWQAAQAETGRRRRFAGLRARWHLRVAPRDIGSGAPDVGPPARARAQQTTREATKEMFPSIYPHQHLDPQPVPRPIWEDLGLTPEQGMQMVPLVDILVGTVRPSRIAMLRHLLGAGLVRVGRIVQGCSDAGSASTTRDPLGTAQ